MLLAALASIFLRPDLIFTQLFLVIGLVFLFLNTLTYINKTNRELARFINAIKNEDYSISFNPVMISPSFRQLNQSFKGWIETLKKHETEKAAQLHFLQKIVDQIEFGIVVFEEDRKIRLINKNASNLLYIPMISDWEKLQNKNIEFLKKIIDLDEEKNLLIEAHINEKNRIFSVNSSGIRIQDKKYLIIAFKDIRSEIQQKEIEAWHKMIRILTHEVMNSVTPLISLIETLEMMLTEDGSPKKPSQFEEEHIQDMTYGVKTIKERSLGILQFIQDYRKLTKIPKPELSYVSLDQLVERVISLYKKEAEKHHISFQVERSEAMLMLDAHLIEQVLINLIKNSIEAISETGTSGLIRIYQEAATSKYKLVIEDNGPGIPESRLEKIFIPFYTSKKEGSGIGLPLSRQILTQHGGELEVQSSPGHSTKFSLLFPGHLLSP